MSVTPVGTASIASVVNAVQWLDINGVVSRVSTLSTTDRSTTESVVPVASGGEEKEEDEDCCKARWALVEVVGHCSAGTLRWSNTLGSVKPGVAKITEERLHGSAKIRTIVSARVLVAYAS